MFVSLPCFKVSDDNNNNNSLATDTQLAFKVAAGNLEQSWSRTKNDDCGLRESLSAAPNIDHAGKYKLLWNWKSHRFSQSKKGLVRVVVDAVQFWCAGALTSLWQSLLLDAVTKAKPDITASLSSPTTAQHYFNGNTSQINCSFYIKIAIIHRDFSNLKSKSSSKSTKPQTPHIDMA